MNVASKPLVTLQDPSQLQTNQSEHGPSSGRRRRLVSSSPVLVSLLLTVASGCGGRTLDDESNTATDALATSTVEGDSEADTTSRDSNGGRDTDTNTVPATSNAGSTNVPSTEGSTSATFTGRCAPAPTASAGTPTSAASTDTSASTGFTSSSVTAVTPATTPANTTSGEGSTSGNTGPIAAGCGARWCWDDAVAASNNFHSVSRDGKYAYGMDGVVFAWPDTYLPPAPISGLGVIEANGDDVWVGNANGLFHYDGHTWSQANTLPLVALSQSAGGTTWALFDSEEAPVRRWSGGEWVAEELPEGTRGLDLLAVSDSTVWVLAGTAASLRREGIRTGELTLYEVQPRITLSVSSMSETQLASPRLVRAGERTLVHDDGGLTQEIYDALTWNVTVLKPSNGIGLHTTPDGNLLTNEWPNLTTFAERGNEVIYGQHCSDVATLDQDSMLCAAYNGGLVRLSRSESR